jgi:hypothetical protein
MRYIDLATLDATPLQREPYDHVVVDGFVRPEWASGISADFPDIHQPGSFPLKSVHAHGAFAVLADELASRGFQASIERKFGVDLSPAATMFTVRGWCRREDGEVHTDSKSKIITVLVYLNEEPWMPLGGRLRLLRSDRLEDTAAEVRPNFGTLLAFRRSDRSWHGHLPFEGQRRILQMNWVTSSGRAAWEQLRHTVSAHAKKLA